MNEIHLGLIAGRHDSMRTSEGGELDAYVWTGHIPPDSIANPHILELDALTWLLKHGDKLDLSNESKPVSLYITGLTHAVIAFFNAWQRFCEAKGRTPRGLTAMHFNPNNGQYEPQAIYSPTADKTNKDMVQKIPLANDCPNDADEVKWIMAAHSQFAQEAILEAWFQITGTYTFAKGNRLMES